MNKVSIIIPVYNVEKYLRRCLDSIVNQTLKEIECLLINDGSPDQSQKIIDEYVRKYPLLFKSYIKENGGLSDARNFGLNYVTGEYIAFVDSDDWIEPTMCEKMYETAVNQSADIVICDFFMEWEVTGVRNYIQGLRCDSNDDFENFLISPSSAWNKLYKADLFLKTNIRYPKGLWYEDLATTTRLVPFCKKLSYVNEAFVHYIQREGSIMSTVNEKILDIYKAIEIIEEYYKINGVYDKYKKEIEYMYIENIALYGNLKFLKLENGNKYIKESIEYMNKKFPSWLENPYIRNLSKNEQIILSLLGRNHLSLLKILIFIKQNVINKLK